MRRSGCSTLGLKSMWNRTIGLHDIQISRRLCHDPQWSQNCQCQRCLYLKMPCYVATYQLSSVVAWNRRCQWIHWAPVVIDDIIIINFFRHETIIVRKSCVPVLLSFHIPWYFTPECYSMGPTDAYIGCSYDGLSPGRRQAIICTNTGILLIGRLETKFSEIVSEIQTYSFIWMCLLQNSVHFVLALIS